MVDLDKEAIRRIIREVISAPERTLPAPDAPQPSRDQTSRNGPTVLNIFHAGVRKLEEALRQVQRIEELAGRSSVYTVESARAWVCGADVREGAGVKCILDTVKPEGLEKVLQRADILVLPTFCLRTAAKLAALICDDQGSNLVLTALLQNKRILAANDGFMICDLLVNPNLKAEIDRILNKLTSFGMVFCTTEKLSTVFQQMLSSAAEPHRGQPEGQATSATVAPAPNPGQKLITAKVIQTAIDNQQKTIELAPGGLVTPLARDLAKEYGIQIFTAKECDQWRS
jgi:hypothetical protein